MRFERLAQGPATRAMDAVLSGPLPEALGRSLVEHRVLERVAESMLETADPDRDTGKTAEILAARLVQSPAFKRALGDVLSSPEVRAALTEQTTGFAGDLAVSGRERLRSYDDAAESRVRRVLRRQPLPPREFGGVATRGVALVADAALAQLAFIVIAASVALVVGVTGGLSPGWLAGTLTGVGWLLVVAIYFVGFWSTAGQTPGMGAMHLRVRARSGEAPSVLRSVVRFAGLILAIIPFFAGFLPALVDSRRRALPDFLAGTTVVYEPD